MPTAALVLAAGGGRRLGGRPKALLPTGDGTTFVERTVSAGQAAGCRPIVVVAGADADRVADLLADRRGVQVVTEPDWSLGMGISLRRGLAALAGTEAQVALVTLVDLPDVGASVLGRVVAAAQDDPAALVRATYRGVPGHPVAIGRDHWAAVAQTALGDRGARDYLAVTPHLAVECGDLADGADVDTPADLAARAPASPAMSSEPAATSEPATGSGASATFGTSESPEPSESSENRQPGGQG